MPRGVSVVVRELVPVFQERQGQVDLSKFQDSRGYIVRTCLIKIK